MIRLCLAAVLVCCGLPAHGETRYWVAVASYESLPAAEQGRTSLEDQLLRSLAIAAAEDGSRYRVIAGPFDSWVEATDVRSTVGIEGAWILRDPTLVSSDDQALSDWSASYGDYPELELDALPAAREPIAPREKARRVLVEEAPADYQLHRLDRQ